MSKIIRLESTNYKRLKAVEIAPDPDGNLVIVAGKNGQGKSSILDSITAALGGVNAKTTPKPIRDGEERAEIILETEDLIVTRRFTASGSTLTVKSPDGAVYTKGQAKLDDLLGKLSLDPLAFTQLDDKAQLKTLLDLVELPFDPAELEAKRAQYFAQRTDVNRDLKYAKGTLDAIKVSPEMADLKPVSVTDLLAQHRAGQESNNRADAIGARYRHWADKVQALRKELAGAEESLRQAERDVDALPAPVNLEALQQQIDNAEQINSDVRTFELWTKASDDVTELQADAAELTADIEAIDKQKADGLTAAKFPIDGLGFDEGGVTYNGVPFKQASSAEQLRVSLAMAIALNPKLRVIRIADGSLLDSDNLALVESIARENDFQVWIEMVGDGDGRGIIIEDGQVALMAGETFLTIIGKLHDDPELKFNPSGSAVTRFTVVSNPRKFNREKNEWENKPGKFWECRAWNQGKMLLAENVANHLKKGDNVILYAELETQVWEAEDGKKRRSDQLRIEAIGKDLRWHQAHANDVPAATDQAWGGNATQGGGWGEAPASTNAGGWG